MEEINKQKMFDAVKELGAVANTISYKPENGGKIISGAIQTLHPTIQQTLIATLVNALIDYESADYDGRNKASVLFARWLKGQLEEHPNYYKGKFRLPFI